MPRDLLDKILADLRHLNGSAVVGALDEENATKLAFAEFGTQDAPDRPTLSAATDEHEAGIFRAVQRDVGKALDGRGVAPTGKEIMADRARDLAEEVQNRIDGNTAPPLAASTLAARRRKGQGDRSLVATGEMLRSIGIEASDDPDAFKDQE